MEGVGEGGREPPKALVEALESVREKRQGVLASRGLTHVNEWELFWQEGQDGAWFTKCAVGCSDKKGVPRMCKVVLNKGRSRTYWATHKLSEHLSKPEHETRLTSLEEVSERPL